MILVCGRDLCRSEWVIVYMWVYILLITQNGHLQYSPCFPDLWCVCVFILKHQSITDKIKYVGGNTVNKKVHGWGKLSLKWHECSRKLDMSEILWRTCFYISQRLTTSQNNQLSSHARRETRAAPQAMQNLSSYHDEELSVCQSYAMKVLHTSWIHSCPEARVCDYYWATTNAYKEQEVELWSLKGDSDPTMLQVF